MKLNRGRACQHPLGSYNAYHLSELDLVFDQSLDELSVVLEVNVVWKHAEKMTSTTTIKIHGSKKFICTHSFYYKLHSEHT